MRFSGLMNTLLEQNLFLSTEVSVYNVYYIFHIMYIIYSYNISYCIYEIYNIGLHYILHITSFTNCTLYSFVPFSLILCFVDTQN